MEENNNSIKLLDEGVMSNYLFWHQNIDFFHTFVSEYLIGDLHVYVCGE